MNELEAITKSIPAMSEFQKVALVLLGLALVIVCVATFIGVISAIYERVSLTCATAKIKAEYAAKTDMLTKTIQSLGDNVSKVSGEVLEKILTYCSGR